MGTIQGSTKVVALAARVIMMKDDFVDEPTAVAKAEKLCAQRAVFENPVTGALEKSPRHRDAIAEIAPELIEPKTDFLPSEFEARATFMAARISSTMARTATIAAKEAEAAAERRAAMSSPGSAAIRDQERFAAADAKAAELRKLLSERGTFGK